MSASSLRFVITTDLQNLVEIAPLSTLKVRVDRNHLPIGTEGNKE
jgi:hypothetical protein